MADEHRAARRGPRRSSGDDVFATGDRVVAADNGGHSGGSVSVTGANVRAGRLDLRETTDHRQRLSVDFARSCLIRRGFADNHASVPGIDEPFPGNDSVRIDNEGVPSAGDAGSCFIYRWRWDDRFVRPGIYGWSYGNRRLRPVIYVPGSHIYGMGRDNSHCVIDNSIDSRPN